MASALEKAGLEERPSRAQRAIELYASGKPMKQASLEIGVSKSWLSVWKCNHPQKFESLLAQSFEKAGLEERKLRNLDRIQQAIELYASGMPITQASQEMGMSKGWLSGWRRSHPEEFQDLYRQACEKLEHRTPSFAHQAIEDYNYRKPA